MQVMGDYACKSPEKSSPSFPEDADDDDERLNEAFMNYRRPPSEGNAPSEAAVDQLGADVTMIAEDDDDEMDPIKPISSGLDSPKPTTESSDKKVHWTTRNVQTLLDCVEEHLHEFNIQKKHKAVWQAIGAEMEPLGFSTEHCYNKWKNLRRDVRLLVNNPMKAVRNASILRRVARLILVIYPNVDATTMQVCGDRSGIKSTPVTPGGSCSSVKSSVTDVRFSGLNSPHCKPENSSISRLTNNLYSLAGNASAHSTPTTVEKSFSGPSKTSVVPGTALFGSSNNVQPSTQNGDRDQQHFNDAGQPRSQSNDSNGTTATPLPFPFNPAAAALLLQTQLFSDVLKQQRKQEELSAQERVRDLASIQNGSFNANLQQGLTNYSNDFSAIPGISTASLTASLLNGLVGLTSASSELGQRIPDAQSSIFSSLPSTLLDRFSQTGELACIVERLQAEEAVHFRLADMIAHLADELRAAGQRRQAALNQLLSLMKGVGISGNTQTATADAGGVA